MVYKCRRGLIGIMNLPCLLFQLKREQVRQQQEVDPEWVELIKEARKLGITIEEIRRFLRKDF